jgi:hypothetical protein
MVRKRTAGNVLQRVGRALSNEQPGRRSRSRSAPRTRRGRSGGAKSQGKSLLRRLLR